MNRAAMAGYSGPLFQLALVSNPATTLNVNQKPDHTVDLSTWSAFCSGTQANCVFSKIYAQVHPGFNDLVPNVYKTPWSLDCSTGGANVCACAFQLNATTGLPEVPLIGNGGLTGGCQYIINGDTTAQGILGTGASSGAIIFTGREIQIAAQCCGVFGISHRYDATDTPGTDFMLGFQYSNTGSYANCTSATIFCFIADWEINTTAGGNLGTSPIEVLGILTYDKAGNNSTGVVNGHAIWSSAPPVSLNSPTNVHLGGGGDLSQPAPGVMRGAYILNQVPSGAQEAALLTNVQAFYPLLSFP